MDKRYSPLDIEEKRANIWKENPLPNIKYDTKFSQVIPPPNVTGTLHMGHSFQYAIMDFYTRYNHMRSVKSYWQIGTDHAGIATQLVVENNLVADGIKKEDLGREKFLEQVWEWKDFSEKQITNQIKRLGCSVNWDKYRFTLDEKFSKAVTKAFVDLFNKDKIYRGYRLVNWDPSLQTAVSDLEVRRQEKEGKIWHIKYPLENDISNFLVIATTRPETMFGDMAVAINPNDKRYLSFIGKNIVLPLSNRIIPIIADEYVDMEFGTGCLKITPGHDFNDYEIGKKYNLYLDGEVVKSSKNQSDFKPINIFDRFAYTNDSVPDPFKNLDRFKARKEVLSELEKMDLLVKEETHQISVPRGERSNVVIEPRLSFQWYVRTDEMAKKANEMVEKKIIRFHPNNWVKTYFNWMNNIEDWCISRQIWWGHRIPAWYDDENNCYVAETEELVRKKYNLGSKVLKQDDDVLDTWFSSSLWPFASLGWPKDNQDLKNFFPTDLLVTGFDIIFFWVARMMMMSIEFTNQIPFKDVYVTGLIRDENGQKMSKSKGNIIDPLDLIYGISLEDLVKKRTSNLMQDGLAEKIEKRTRKQFPNGIDSYGSDALRMMFFSLATHAKEISFEMGRLKGYRNFCTKIWNAGRFIQNFENHNEKFEPKNNADNKILNDFNKCKQRVERNIEEFRLDLAMIEVYEFFWSKFCDEYLEACKNLNETKNLLPIYKEILVFIHPFAPFITEELHTIFFNAPIIER